ncbi:GAF domain-containing sensor histidine kinase [Actinoallomurus bryophytorum]|nr:GAF domain-containing sensor histidine kinase [Actinoallomurus bryophytorum]
MRTSLDAAVRPWRTEVSEVRQLAEERGALQYVATLVARGSSPSVIFNAAASALGSLIRADYTAINRCEIDQTMSIVTLWRAAGTPDIGVPFGGRWSPGEDTPSAEALRSHRPARRATAIIGGDIGGWHRERSIGHIVACPVIVDDRLWGTMSALYLGSGPPPDDTEERMGKFLELLNCAITQAETRGELIASRARLVDSADAARRSIERDLHDGVQQHLISLALQMRETEARVPPEQQELRQRLADTAEGLSDTLDELQGISTGLQPPVLTRDGLDAALEALVSRFPGPVGLHIDVDGRLPEELEVAIYYVASEALTNALKHAYATNVRIDLDQEDSKVRLSVRDDGVGGADAARGTGLTGLKDRVEALGGTIRITSPVAGGTTLLATIPRSG